MIQFLNNLRERMRANTDARRQRIAERMQGIRDKSEARNQYSAYHQQQREGNSNQQFSGQTPPPPNKWEEKTERLKAERAMRMEAGTHNHPPQSKTAKRINWFIAPVSAIGGMIITKTNTWPTIPIRKFITGMGLKSDLLVFLPIGLVIMVLAAIVAAAVTKQLEKKSADQHL